MSDLRVDRLHVRAAVPGPDGEARVRALLADLGRRRLEEATAAAGLPGGEWCLRRVDVALGLDDRCGDGALARRWADTIVAAVSTAAAGPDAVHFARPGDATADVVAGLALGDTGRAWAWRAVGALTAGDPDPAVAPRDAALAALGRDPSRCLPALGAAVHRAGLPAVHRLLGAAGWERAAAVVLAAAGQRPDRWVHRAAAGGAGPADRAVADRILARSTLARAWRDGRVRPGPACLPALSVLVAAEAEPALFRCPSAGTVLDLLAPAIAGGVPPIEPVPGRHDPAGAAGPGAAGTAAATGSPDLGGSTGGTGDAPGAVVTTRVTDAARTGATSPTGSTDPTSRTGPADPTDPASHTGPGDPTDPTSRTGPADSTDPTSHTGPADPNGTTGTAGPAGPAETAGTAGTAGVMGTAGAAGATGTAEAATAIGATGSAGTADEPAVTLPGAAARPVLRRPQPAGDLTGTRGTRPERPGTSAAHRPEDAGRATVCGGLVHLLATAAEAGLPDAALADAALAGRAPSWVLLQLARRLCAGAPDDDPAPGALSGGGPADLADRPTAAQQRRLDAHARRWAAVTAARLRTEEDPDRVVARLVARRGTVEAVPGWVEFRLRLDDVDLAVRRAGLDLDPGFVPWLGAVVVIRYD